ncbi:protein OS-9 homolog isoform X1 [Aristolochia californica]|uniref:protein OS-9 homolog isoform X1 n=1 Tax=Aristolochia californica TaxID=171875 RepID=UPI0035DEB175
MRNSWFIIVVLAFLINQALLSDQIAAAVVGGTYSRSSRNSKYMIDFHSAESPYHPDEDQESIVMSDKTGKPFLCFLPAVEESNSGQSTSQLNSSSIIVESERQIKLKTPDELMEVMKDLCWTRQEGWWNYEFCHLKHLRQFHLENGKVVQEFILGVYDPEATAAFNHNRSDVSIMKDPRSKDASQRYHAHLLTNGTVCDLTSEPRETEVRFICAESRVLISSVKEIATCKYAIMIHCPMLCKHPMFQEERAVWHTINCNEMPTGEGYKASVNEHSFKKDKSVLMITEVDEPTQYAREEYAT